MPTIKHRLVGAVSYRILAPDANGTRRLDMDDKWEAENIVTVFVPQLVGVMDGTTGGSSGKIRFHKKGVKQLLAAFAEVEARGLKHLILAFAGSYYPRMMRGSKSSPSEHSFGCALDVNAPWNGLNRTPAKKGSEGSMHEIAAIFKKHGFDWGGDWTNPEDGMHLQIREWMDEKPVAAPKPVVAPPKPQRGLFLNGIEVEDARLIDGHYEAEVVNVLVALGLGYGTDEKRLHTPTEYHLKVWGAKK